MSCASHSSDPSPELNRRAALALAAGLGGSALVACSGSDEAIDPGPAGESVGSVSDFEDGAFVARTSTGLQIVVLDVDGEVRAFTAVCPHANCTVRLKEGMLDCPCHGSLFSTDDGSVQRGPAREGLEPVAVTLDGDSIVLSSSAS